MVNSIMNPDGTRLEKIYHYTNIEACTSILKENKLWAADYRFVNDRRELQAGLEDFFEKCPEEKKESIKVAVMFYAQHYFHCIVSFSKSGKVLSQWRAYADDGQGVAIGFSREALERRGISLYDCRYKNNEKYIESLASKYSDFIQLIYDKYIELGAINSFFEWVIQEPEQFKPLVHELMIMKNPAFEEEGEVRAIKTVSIDEALYRNSGGMLVPYTEFEFWDSVEDGEIIRYIVTPNIVLGPRCDLRNELSLGALALGVSFSHYDCGYTN